MKCPHFEKIYFERINEIKNEEAETDQYTHQPLNSIVFPLDALEEDICSIPQEGNDHLNSFKSKISNYKHTFSTLNIKEDSIRKAPLNVCNDSIKEGSTIKMPKQMNVKKMISSSQCHISNPFINLLDSEDYHYSKHIIYTREEQYSEDGDIPSQNQHSSGKKKPQILISKTSMMAQDNLQIFNGLVFLRQSQDCAFQCYLKDYVIRILRQGKVKYFIELQKVSVSIQDLENNQRGVKVSLKCKSKNDCFRLYFVNPFQRQIFKQVYSHSVKKIKETRKIRKLIEQDKQNLANKTNSMPHNDDEQSRILDEKNQLNNQQQLSQSISSMSMNSYQGDSMVFQTERMLFQQVNQTSNTFDILLFKNNSLMSKVQRIFTNSDYDHAALLLKTASNDLLMLEATSNAGVAIYTFNSLMKIDKSKYFSRIGLRKYTGDKSIIKISRLQNFIRKTVGKKYKFDPMYLIKSEANQQKQTYFCSQLVAQALQDAGILSNQFPSFKYLPKHLASESLNNDIISGRYSDTIILE